MSPGYRAGSLFLNLLVLLPVEGIPTFPVCAPGSVLCPMRVGPCCSTWSDCKLTCAVSQSERVPLLSLSWPRHDYISGMAGNACKPKKLPWAPSGSSFYECDGGAGWRGDQIQPQHLKPCPYTSFPSLLLGSAAVSERQGLACDAASQRSASTHTCRQCRGGDGLSPRPLFLDFDCSHQITSNTFYLVNKSHIHKLTCKATEVWPVR